MSRCKICNSLNTINALCDACLNKLDDAEIMFGKSPSENHNGEFKGLAHIFKAKLRTENNNDTTS